MIAFEHHNIDITFLIMKQHVERRGRMVRTSDSQTKGRGYPDVVKELRCQNDA
jgi:hypothetical protein